MSDGEVVSDALVQLCSEDVLYSTWYAVGAPPDDGPAQVNRMALDDCAVAITDVGTPGGEVEAAAVATTMLLCSIT